MNWHLVLLATKNDRFQDALTNVLGRIKPGPEFVTVIDPGKRAKAEKSLTAGELSFEQATGVVFDSGTRRRHLGKPNENDARARAWAAVAESSYPVVLYFEDRYRFVRSLDLRDPGYVLEQEQYLAQISFRLLGTDEPAGELRGGGVVRWRLRESGFSTAPFLVRPWVAKAFPWPDSPDELETGLRGALPDVRFGSWGNGDPWVVVANGAEDAG